MPKLPIERAVVGTLGVQGDRQESTRSITAVPSAPSASSPSRSIEALQAEGHPIGPGGAGENVTITGLDWDAVAPGSRLRLGPSVLIEITGYTAPCYKIEANFSDRRLQPHQPEDQPGLEPRLREGDRGRSPSSPATPSSCCPRANSPRPEPGRRHRHRQHPELLRQDPLQLARRPDRVALHLPLPRRHQQAPRRRDSAPALERARRDPPLRELRPGRGCVERQHPQEALRRRGGGAEVVHDLVLRFLVSPGTPPATPSPSPPAPPLPAPRPRDGRPGTRRPAPAASTLPSHGSGCWKVSPFPTSASQSLSSSATLRVMWSKGGPKPPSRRLICPSITSTSNPRPRSAAASSRFSS